MNNLQLKPEINAEQGDDSANLPALRAVAGRGGLHGGRMVRQPRRRIAALRLPLVRASEFRPFRIY